MTPAQWLALLGGGAQAVALAWAWVALFRVWRLRWPDQPLMPRLARAWQVVLARVESLWYRITGRQQSATMHVGSGIGTIKMGGSAAVGYAGGTVEERVTNLEARFRLMETHHSDSMRELRESFDERVTAISEEQRRERQAADELEQREARFNLTGPAALAIIGTLLQVWAAFVPGASA